MNSNRLAALAGVLLATAFLGAVQAQPSPPRPLPLSDDVVAVLDQVRAKHGIPGMAAAVVRDGEVVAVGVSGVREAGEADPIRPDDRFHIGSCTKAMTATMIARLVEQGRLRWDVTLAESFPHTTITPELRPATLRQLLSHQAGIQPYKERTSDSKIWEPLPASLRHLFVEHVLNEPRYVREDGELAYSNAGYCIAGAIAERATRETYESLMRRLVFEPLGMDTAGFGWPATPSRPDQPRGHRRTPEGPVPQPLDDATTLPAFLSVAGDVHCSVADLARFVALHLRGLQGRDGLLKAETIRFLHQVPGDEGSYSLGWAEAGPVAFHFGSAGTFTAAINLFPSMGLGFAIVQNVEEQGEEINEVFNALLPRFSSQGRAPSSHRDATVSSSSSAR